MYIYLTNKLLFAYNALRHSRYAELYAPLVKAYVPSVMDAPHSCIFASYPRGSAGKLRPDALDLQAQVLLRDAQARRADSDIEGARDLLNKAKAAATLGGKLIVEVQQPDRDKARNSKSFVDRISETGPIDTSNSLKRTLQAIASETDDLDR
jgi:hypothetical protein